MVLSRGLVSERPLMSDKQILTDTSIELAVKDVVDGARRAANNEGREERLGQLHPIPVEWKFGMVRRHGQAPCYGSSAD